MLRRVAETEVVGEAGTVAEALAAIPRLNPDLVFLDIRMPDGDGISVLRKLKAGVGAPIVAMLTNYADDYHRHHAEAAGADFFLDKSKQFDLIPGILQRLMRTRVHHDG